MSGYLVHGVKLEFWRHCFGGSEVHATQACCVRVDFPIVCAAALHVTILRGECGLRCGTVEPARPSVGKAMDLRK